MSLDRQLQRALARKRPAAGFRERVLARLAGSPAAPPPIATRDAGRRSRRRFALSLGAGLALAGLIGAGVHHRAEERERREGERASQQVMTAFHIAGAKMRLAQQQLLQITSERAEEP
jgi:hypothetical protein